MKAWCRKPEAMIGRRTVQMRVVDADPDRPVAPARRDSRLDGSLGAKFQGSADPAASV
jgi:hypothetical protein